jgi:hypothetical protein
MSILVYMQQESTIPWRSNRELFDAEVSLDIQRALLRSIFENYAQSSEFCWANFSGPQAKNLSGYHRWAKIEDEWAGIAVRFTGRLTVETQSYKNGTGFYNEVTCGRVVLTQSCVAFPDEAPRRAQFRQTLAQSGQFSLFTSNDVPADGYLYAVLIHGVDVLSERRSRPAFARIEFPDQECRRFLAGGIDLFMRFPEVVSEYIGEVSEPNAEPRRRQWRRRGTA